jgi:hypothetical protein
MKNLPMKGGIGGVRLVCPPGRGGWAERRIIIRPSKSAADEASILAEMGAPLVVRPGATVRPHAWFMDANALHAYRHTMETVNRHLETMGSERLYARTNAGFERKAP